MDLSRRGSFSTYMENSDFYTCTILIAMIDLKSNHLQPDHLYLWRLLIIMAYSQISEVV